MIFPSKSLPKSPLQPCLEPSWALGASKTAPGANRRPSESKNHVRGSLFGPHVGVQKLFFGIKHMKKCVLKSLVKSCVLEAFEIDFCFCFKMVEPSKMRFSCGRGAIFWLFGFIQVKPQKVRSDFDFGGHLGRVLAGFGRVFGLKMAPEKRSKKCF